MLLAFLRSKEMLSRSLLFRKISRVFPCYMHSGGIDQHVKQSSTCAGSKTVERRIRSPCSYRSFSIMSEAPQEFPQEDLLTFFKSSIDDLEGPNHFWLNKFEESRMPFRKDELFLVLSGVFCTDSIVSASDQVLMFERVKYLQRRYPHLHVFGFQCDTSIHLVPSQAHIVQTIMNEYLTFPILLSNKKFSEVKKGCYYLFKDFKSPMLYYDKGTEIGVISKAIEELNSIHKEISKMSRGLKGTGFKELDVIREPSFSLRNLFLCYPGCISADEEGNRLFLSDSNHHRIIILDSDGKILDCIGSSPGYEDGEFETAKLLRPAASVYEAVEDCLYFVDSENHAIRRVDLGQRVLETIYPPCSTSDKFSHIWTWVSDKLGIGKDIASKSEEFDLEPLVTPWHLMKSRENKLLIVNRSFQTLWIMDPVSGKIENVVTGYPNILEICGETITERVSLLKQIFGDKLKHEVHCSSIKELLDVSLMSSLAAFHRDIIFCDTVGQAVLKINRESGIISNLHPSNFGKLGLPYWLTLPLEKVFTGANRYQKLCIDHIQCLSVLPGRCDIQVNIDIPVDTELAGPLQEGCIWRQARGPAAEISGFEDVDKTEKVGVAQQWFDELDNLAFTSVGQESNVDDGNGDPGMNIQNENRVHIRSAINISPGTSEVIIYAALYLKMKKDHVSNQNLREENVKRILSIVNHKNEMPGNDACIQLLLKTSRDIGEIVFMKPLHLRLEFDCQDHPKADKPNDVILTDSAIEVNVSLK